MMRVYQYLILLLLFACLTAPARAQQSAAGQLQSMFDALNGQDLMNRDPVLSSRETPEGFIRKNMFIKVSASKTSCFLGEPVLVTYQLYSALHNQSKISKQPAFSGCSVVEMTTDEPAYTQTVNNKMYRVYLIRKVQVTPLREGILKLDTASVDNDVNFYSPADPSRTELHSATLSSAPLAIAVKPLPDSNKPADFSGIVGNFSIAAKIDSSNIAKGESNNLEIQITGQGNLEAINQPFVNWPAGVDHFEGTDSQHIDKMNYPVKGDKTFEIPFVATKTGTLAIPPIRFSYFNPDKRMYETVETAAMPVTITPMRAAAVNILPVVSEDITNRKYLWIVPAIALTALFIFLISTKKDKHKPVSPVPEKTAVTLIPAELQPPSPLQLSCMDELRLLEQVTDSQEFFTHTKAILTRGLEEYFTLPQQPEPVLLTAMHHSGKHVTLIATVESIYKICNLSLYSPLMDEGIRQQVFEQLSTVISELTAAKV